MSDRAIEAGARRLAEAAAANADQALVKELAQRIGEAVDGRMLGDLMCALAETIGALALADEHDESPDAVVYAVSLLALAVVEYARRNAQ